MSYQLELRHYHYFQILADELHFRKASERLFISQPGLSRQIKQMEHIFGAQLFERGKRYVRLTPAGRYLKSEVDLLFQRVDIMEREVRLLAEESVMELRLGFIGSAVQAILGRLLITLKRDYPRIDVDLQELSNSIQIEKIIRQELDFGFVRMDAVPKGLQHMAVLTEHFSLVVPQGHPIQHDNFQGLDAFVDEPFILFSKDYSHSYYDLVYSIFQDAGFEPQVALRTVNALSIFNLVEQGLGVAIVPSSLRWGYTSSVKFIDLDYIPQRTTLSLVWNNDLNPEVSALFLSIVQQELGGAAVNQMHV
ncbi:LysR family transcriptional regulator [Sphingobacterium suaedae]|uniref:LysR family transcriptional regulator n=1 Tax=Sphingobacterium suaedae TaxID=1686402 RepID=A0ABW5KN54_9SPHI